MKIGYRKGFFGVMEFLFMNFDLKNVCKKKFKDNSEKSCILFRSRVSNKIDLTAVRPYYVPADIVGVKVRKSRSERTKLEFFYAGTIKSS